MIDLNSSYKRAFASKILKSFLPEDLEFHLQPKDIRLSQQSKRIKKAHIIAEVPSLDITIFELHHSSPADPRIELSKEAFRILAESFKHRAIVIIKNQESDQWRLSLMTIDIGVNKKGNAKQIYSNPRRYSYLLGPDAKIVTPGKYLIRQGKVKSFEDLQKRFAPEVVNNEFYKEIAKLYDELVGSDVTKKVLKYPGGEEDSYEFAVRLIGRIIFCWFLREKKSGKDLPLIPKNLLSRDAANTPSYYHETLAPLFFEVLNKDPEKRSTKFKKNGFQQIPYLNGGLFSDDEIDHYRFDKALELSIPGLISVPDLWLQKLFDLLELYNFTVDENTSYDVDLSIDPEMLGRVFENLLARINPETGETVRKSTGSFYTPREIVDYMVDVSLTEYLFAKTKVSRAKIEALVSYDLEDDVGNGLTKEEGKQVLEALSTLTVLDPACGSGAFPIGMLQKIVFVISILDPDAKWWLSKQLENASHEIKREFENKGVDYIRKLGIIRQTIFGVDIQPIATEISRLRCFLTLIVDEDVDDNAWNRGIRPLPNLDFKFVTANTLIPLPNPEDKTRNIGENQAALFEETSHIDELRALRNEYFTSTSHERSELQAKFSDLQRKMFIKNIDEFGGQASGLYEYLSRWEPFSHQPSEWFDPEWMFGIKDGFNIVIANPPYIHLEKMSKELRESVKSLRYKTYEARGDIYALFYERGIKLLKDKGLLTYITSNKWMRSGYGISLRDYFVEYTEPLQLIDLGGDIFDATVDTNILMIKKSSYKHSTMAVIVDNDFDIRNISNYIRQRQTSMRFKKGDSWAILSPIEQGIKEKIERYGTPLKDWDIKINYGVKTGLNEAFIIDGKKRDELIAADPKSDELIRPILRGKDIKHLSYVFADQYVILAYFGSHKIIPVQYPALYQHLKKYENALKSRGQCRYTSSGRPNTDADYPGQHHWLELDNNPRQEYMDDFDRQKIIYREISTEMNAVIDNKGYVVNNKCYLITGEHLKGLCRFFNSRLFKIILKTTNPTGGKGPEFIKSLTVIPKSRADTVTDDLALYRHYNLTQDEINYLETL